MISLSQDISFRGTVVGQLLVSDRYVPPLLAHKFFFIFFLCVKFGFNSS
jgi:hypothetical protein